MGMGLLSIMCLRPGQPGLVLRITPFFRVSVAELLHDWLPLESDAFDFICFMT